MLVAVTVLPDTVPTTLTVSPDFTSPISLLPLFTVVEASMAYVVLWPSALFAVIDEELTAVTVPLCSRFVTYPPLPSDATKSPCSAPASPAAAPPRPPPSNIPLPPGPPPKPPPGRPFCVVAELLSLTALATATPPTARTTAAA